MSSHLDSITSTDSGNRRLGPSVAAGALTLVGLAAIALGGVLTTGVIPMSGSMVQKLASNGVDGAWLVGVGVIACSLAVVARSVRAHATALARALDPEHVGASLEERVAALEASTASALRELQQALGNAMVMHDQKLELLRQESRAASPKDAVFRLAASLDQLGARIDQRIGEVRTALDRSIYELGQRVETARDQLERSFQDTIHSIGTLSAEETLASGFDDRLYTPEPVRSPEPRGPSLCGEQPRLGELALELERDAVEEPPPSPPPPVDIGLLAEIGEDASPAPRPQQAHSQPAPLPQPQSRPSVPQHHIEPPAPIPAPAPALDQPVAPPATRTSGPIPLPKPNAGWWNEGEAPRRR